MENSSKKSGRPKKYFSYEERLIAGRGYCKKFNDNNIFYCDLCQFTLHPASKYKHLKSHKHLENIIV